jgi:2-C-methyl-D-erythritol 2,4-cyclodiphosphate synthase
MKPSRSNGTRIGQGYDIHRLKRGGNLKLGGVAVAKGISPVAHSDGDVVIHAIVDALLGAMGWGDIGEMFPDTDARWKNADSRIFLDAVMERLRKAKWRVGNVDVTILAERPKLQPFKEEIRRNLKAMLGGDVNIKAGTNEGCDAIGKGKAIACHAVVLLVAGN